ncbi:MAG: hypothetical protein SCM11_20350 [Bacillota bacterium]|nr:hypothetical protein [Bacillota bacterium]
MNKRMKVTVFAVCALLMCLMASTVMALMIKSTAYIDYGSSSFVYGGVQDLNTNALYGTVTSTYATGEAVMHGYMWTAGFFFQVLRDYDSVAPGGDAKSLHWSNPSKETGDFFAEAVAPSGNHEGTCQIRQYGH